MLVTGTSRGIGNYIAKYYARKKYLVIGCSRSASNLKIESYIHNRIDISESESVVKMISNIRENYGRLDALVNNAGIATGAPVEKMSVSMWDHMINTNLRSVFLCTHFMLPHMYKQGYGKIVSTASQLAYLGSPFFGHYCASKAGIIAFTRSLSREIGKRNINANCVAPGATETPMLKDLEEDHLNEIKSMIPKGKLAKVDQIIPAYIYLASDESSHMVGQTISPNGGDIMI